MKDETGESGKVEFGAWEVDPLFLFLCHLEWRDNGNVHAYQVLVAALDNADEEIRKVAECLLHRTLPRPKLWRGSNHSFKFV